MIIKTSFLCLYMFMLFLSVQSHFHRNRIKSSGPNKDDQQQEEHPLKIRVNVLMKHRMGLPVSPSNTQVYSSLCAKC